MCPDGKPPASAELNLFAVGSDTFGDASGTSERPAGATKGHMMFGEHKHLEEKLRERGTSSPATVVAVHQTHTAAGHGAPNLIGNLSSW